MKTNYKHHIFSYTTGKIIHITHNSDPDDLLKIVKGKNKATAMKRAKDFVDRKAKTGPKYTYVVSGITWKHEDPRAARLPTTCSVKHGLKTLKDDRVVELIENTYKVEITKVSYIEVLDN